jgi:hypothetical protein
VAGATVRVAGEASASTDADGRFSLDGVPIGTHDVVATSRDGFGRATVTPERPEVTIVLGPMHAELPEVQEED